MRVGFIVRLHFMLVLSGLFLCREAAGQCVGNEDQKLTAGDAAAGDAFGLCVSVDGTVAAVGAVRADDAGIDSGSAYVYRHDGTGWVETQKLTASDGAAGDWFGISVAVSGNVLVVGAHSDFQPSGAAYVYRYDGTQWSEEQKLVPSAPDNADSFGSAVAVNGNVVVVGARTDGPQQGSAYVYRHDGTRWVDEQKLTASDAADGDNFGDAVSVDGNVTVIGAYLDDDKGLNSGSAYVFRHDGTQWVEEQKLTASDGSEWDRYSWFAVSVSGNAVLVGSHHDSDTEGSAYVYRHDGTQWVEEQKLTASDAGSGDYFARSVSLDGTIAVLGAYFDDDVASDAGAAYVFRYDGTNWVERQKLTASDGGIGDRFGYWVSVSGGLALLGAKFDDDAGTDSGSVYAVRIADLALTTDVDSIGTGSTLTFTTCGGLATGFAMLFAVDLGGTPIFLTLGQGNFDGSGQWTLGGTVPPGLSGLAAQFQAVGFYQPGQAGISNQATVTFL